MIWKYKKPKLITSVKELNKYKTMKFDFQIPRKNYFSIQCYTITKRTTSKQPYIANLLINKNEKINK